MQRVVIDTNVVISAFLKTGSNPALIISLILENKIKLCLSKKIFSEYKGVLSRNKFNHLDKTNVKSLLSRLKKKSLLIKPSIPIDIIKDDPADNKFLECAIEAKADFLITGNIMHFPFKKFHNTYIITPKEFLILITKVIN